MVTVAGLLLRTARCGCTSWLVPGWCSPNERLRLLLFGCLAGFTVALEGLAAPFVDEIGASPSTVGWPLAVEPAIIVLGAWLLGRMALARRPSLLGVLAVGTSVLVLVLVLVYYTSPGLELALMVMAVSGVCPA